MDSQNQNASLQRLQNVEKRIVSVLKLAGGAMEEFSNPSGPRKELVNSHCSEFIQLMKFAMMRLETGNNDIIDDEDALPYDLADSDDEDLVNVDDDDGVNV
ncbi:mediator of RNA polymerase II transcription subunit 11-like protein isoform X1, partial [Tanacetum coccineum]